jgi:hypothetical protein
MNNKIYYKKYFNEDAHLYIFTGKFLALLLCDMSRIADKRPRCHEAKRHDGRLLSIIVRADQYPHQILQRVRSQK